jgi:hypothetical protein
MDILYFVIGWLAGLSVGSFTLVQMLIILFFGFPVTRKLQKAGLLSDNNNIQRNNVISLIILSGIFISAWFVISYIFPGVKIGFIFGGGMALLMSIGKCGMNANNLSDYIQSNKEFLKIDGAEAISKISGK